MLSLNQCLMFYFFYSVQVTPVKPLRRLALSRVLGSQKASRSMKKSIRHLVAASRPQQRVYQAALARHKVKSVPQEHQVLPRLSQSSLQHCLGNNSLIYLACRIAELSRQNITKQEFPKFANMTTR